MSVESAIYVTDLNDTLPLNTDQKLEGDDHIRLIKTTCKNSFPLDLRMFELETIGGAARRGQVVRFDGANLNVNVRARVTELTVTPMTVTSGGSQLLYSVVEDGLDLAVGSGEIEIPATCAGLAVQLKGTVNISGMGPTARLIFIMRDLNTGTNQILQNFYPGANAAVTPYTIECDFFFIIPPSLLIFGDRFYFNLSTSIGGSATFSDCKLYFYDMG